METREIHKNTFNGWAAIPALIMAGLMLGFLWIALVIQKLIATGPSPAIIITIVILGLISLTWLVCWGGFFTLQPNISAVLILFGKYHGTEMSSGFHWANPLLIKKKVSKRAHNLNGDKLKVNDKRGNPIEIAVVVVWKVTDTAKAVFDVEDFVDYVTVQSEAALRHLAMAYSYDTFDGDELTLRGSVDEVSESLQKEVQERVTRAGVLVEEARISHLAYAAEIASAMLQRQQADAIVAARQRIVEGAVGMVEMALAKLEEHKTVNLDEERKASMVSNLLVVLCGDKAAQPIVNAGTLYS